MSLIVQKFGGTSVANTERLKNVADIVTKTAQAGNQVVVVVSAQGDTTDDLIVKAAELNDRPSKREMDVLLNTGEMISMSLLAMAIQKLGFPVVSLTGWQIGLETNSNYSDARIKRIAGERLKAELDNGRIVIVAGFQGINQMGDVTTLGRGGSDTTAVAIAATLGADLCQIYTDVDGVYTADPRIVRMPRSWTPSPMMRCWSWHLWVHRCCTTVRLRWQRSTMSILRSFRALPAIRVPKSRRVLTWKN